MNPLVRFTLGVMSSLGISTPPEGKETRAAGMFWAVLAGTACFFLLVIALIIWGVLLR